MTETRANGILVRRAVAYDVPQINAIAARSVRAFHQDYDDADLIERAIRNVYGVDWQLVRDETYFVAEVDGSLAGAGGWSFRQTIGGAHGPDTPPSPRLEPTNDAARIRAFYVDPAYARRGVARLLLDVSEKAARHAGFASAELTATLASETAWVALGYRTVSDYVMRTPDGGSLSQKLMRKKLLADAPAR